MGPVSRRAPLSAPSPRGFGRGTSSVSARRHRVVWSGTARSSPSRPMTEPISPSVCRYASRNTALNVSAVRIARSEYSGCPPRLVRRSASHASTASSENQTVKLPRRRRLSSYSRQFVTLRFCSGMWRRRSWFSLKGKAGIPGQTKGRPATSIGPRVPPVGSLQQRAVRKYAAAESFPVPEARPLRRSILDPYLAHVQARLAEGCENALALWRELRAAGFPGTAKQVQRWVAEHRTAPAPSTPHQWRTKTPAHAPRPAPQDGAPALPSPPQLAWLLVQPPAALSGPDAALVARVEQDPTAAHVAGLARRLTALVRGCGVNPTVGPEAARVALDTWLADARRSGVRALETFAAGLEQDGAAIRAALTTPWSSGQAEGQITRLKLIKRQMYGRASFDLLRQRVLLAA